MYYILPDIWASRSGLLQKKVNQPKINSPTMSDVVVTLEGQIQIQETDVYHRLGERGTIMGEENKIFKAQA